MLEELIKSSTGLIWAVAKKFYGVDKNDLYQAGVLGVVKAYQNYVDDGKSKFSTYAYNYIFGEMYALANNKEIKLNKDINRLIKMIEMGKARLSQEIMKVPSNKELAQYLEMEEEKLEQILSYANSFVSMDEVCDDERSMHEVLALEERVSVDEKLELKNSINSLDAIEKDIIKSRYYEDLTQSETARKLGITQVMVSRYEKRSLTKMRDYMYSRLNFIHNNNGEYL